MEHPGFFERAGPFPLGAVAEAASAKAVEGADLGQPIKDVRPLDSADIRLSTGFSIIWQSPLGPLRADIGQALLKAKFDQTELFRFGASTNF